MNQENDFPDKDRTYISPSKETIMAHVGGEWQMFLRQDKVKGYTEEVVKVSNESLKLRELKWISVDERLPLKEDDQKEFLVYVKQVVNDNIEVAQWWDYGDEWGFNIHHGLGYKREVTHWMPLPESPN